MLQLSAGTLLATVLSDWRGEVTRGFLFMAAAGAFICGLLAFGLAGLGRVEGGERTALGVLIVLNAVYIVLLAARGRSARLAVGLAALGLGLLVLGQAALARPSPILGPWSTAAAFVLSALALGTALGGLLLGHWYLTTPSLTSRPLRRLCDLLLASLLPLTGLAAWYLLMDAGAPAPVGLTGWAMWVGAGMVTVFPFGVTIAARACCVDGPGRGRSIQAATGLLYLVAAAVLAGGLAGNAVLLGV